MDAAVKRIVAQASAIKVLVLSCPDARSKCGWYFLCVYVSLNFMCKYCNGHGHQSV